MDNPPRKVSLPFSPFIDLAEWLSNPPYINASHVKVICEGIVDVACISAEELRITLPQGSKGSIVDDIFVFDRRGKTCIIEWIKPEFEKT